MDLMQSHAVDFDSLYREGYDGYIGIKRVTDDQSESGLRLEMVTLIDISNVPDEQLAAAHEQANSLQRLSHENLLNFTAAY